MATSNRRDTTLGVGIETSGEDGLRRLATDVRALAKAGGDAAPEYARLATQFDKLAAEAAGLASLKTLTADVTKLTAEQARAATVAADLAADYAQQAGQVDRLKTAQQQAEGVVRQTRDGLAAARQALRDLNVEYAGADKSVADYTSRQANAREEIKVYRQALVAVRDALKDATAEANAAARTEKALSTEYGTAARAAIESTTALNTRKAALTDTEVALRALGVDTKNLAAADEQLAVATRLTVDAARAQQQAEINAAAALKDAAEATLLSERAQQALFNIRKAAAAQDTAAKTKAEAAAERDAADAALQSERAQQALFNIRKAAAAQDTAAQLKAEAVAQREAAAAAALAEKAQQALFNIRKAAGQQLIEDEAAARREAEATRLAAEASQRKAAASREQAEADRLAAIQARGLAEAQERARAAAQSELAAIRESELFMQRYAAQVREAAIANGQLRASAQELATAFGVTGLRSMQAIDAEIRKVNAAMALLQAQNRAGAISAEDLARATSAAGARIQQLRQEILAVPAASTAFEAMGAQVNGLVTKFGSLAAIVATAGIAFRPLLDSTIQLDQMSRVLTTVTGSTAAAAKQIEFLREVSQRAGQSVKDIGESYSKFATSASAAGVSMDVVQKTFSAVSLATGNLGLSSDKTKRALEALSQMASKGTVQMEELKGQLGDALPGALGLMAKGLGITQGQLIKLVESGGLLAENALPALAEALVALGPAGGEVKGIVAEFNRLKNVVFEAGAVFVDGPFGAAIGLTLKTIGTTIGFIAIGVSTISEAFRVAGVVIYETINLIATRDMETFKTAVAQAASESTDRLVPLINRFAGVSNAAQEAAAGVQAATRDLQISGTQTAAVATQVGQATAAYQAHTAAVGAVATAHTAAGASTQVAVAQTSQLEDITRRASETYVQYTVRIGNQTAAARTAATAADRHVQAVKSSNDAVVKAIDLAGDDIATKRAQATAAEATAAALRNQAAADQRVLDLLLAGKAEMVAELERKGRTKIAIEDQTKAITAKIVAATSEVEKTKASAAAAESEVAVRQTLSESLSDNSASYAALTINVEAAREELLRLQALYAAGRATLEDVTAATLKLSAAIALQRDALKDATSFSKLYLDSIKATNAGISAGLTVKEADAQASLKWAQTNQNARAELDAELKIRTLQIERVKASAAAKVAEAEASIKVLENSRAEVTGLDQASVERRRAIDISIELERVKLREADASRAVVSGLEAEKLAFERRNAAAAGSLSSTFDQNKNNARSTVGGPTYDKDGFATNPDGSRITAGTQLTPPDGSGEWQFVSDARANGGTQTFTKDGRTMTGIGVTGQGYWVKASGVVAGLGGNGGSARGPSYGFNTPAYGTAKSPEFSQVNTNIPSGSSTDPYAALGLTSPTAARDAAISARSAFLQILNSNASAATKQEAFKKYAQIALQTTNGTPDADLRSLANAVGVSIDTVAKEVKFTTVGGDKAVISDQVDSSTTTGSSGGSGGGGGGGGGTQATPSAAGGTTHTVTINLGGKATTVNAASADDASALVDVLRDLGEAARRS